MGYVTGPAVAKELSAVDKARAAAKATSIPDRNKLGTIAAGEIAEAITLIEAGRAASGLLRLRLLLRKHAHPEPAPTQRFT